MSMFELSETELLAVSGGAGGQNEKNGQNQNTGAATGDQDADHAGATDNVQGADGDN